MAAKPGEHTRCDGLVEHRHGLPVGAFGVLNWGPVNFDLRVEAQRLEGASAGGGQQRADGPVNARRAGTIPEERAADAVREPSWPASRYRDTEQVLEPSVRREEVSFEAEEHVAVRRLAQRREPFSRTRAA